MVLKIDSPAQQVMFDLRQTAMVGGIRVGLHDDQVKTRAKHIQTLNLPKLLADGHVFDTRGVAVQDRTLFRSNPADRWNGWCLPFPTTILIDHMDDAAALMVTVLTGDAESLVADTFHYYAMTSRGGHLWLWIARMHFHDGVEDFLGLNMADETQRNAAAALSGAVIADLLMLNSKGDAVIVEPATWVLDTSGKPLKAFQKPNPSVSIVKVNTARILRPPVDIDDGSGATVRPHDRRSHLRRRGNRITQVRASKIHGGSPTPVIKMVQVD